MQSVNGAQFLNITSLLLSFETAAIPVSATQSILAQSLVLNLGGWFGILSNNLLFFGISLLYYYINLKSLIILCISFGDIYLFLDIFFIKSCIFFVSFSAVSELFSGEVFETFAILLLLDLFTRSAILLPIKSPFASAVFWIALFEAVLTASVADCLVWSRSFWLHLLFKVLLIF